MRRDAGFTATGAGIDVPAGTRVLLAEPNVVGADTHLEPSLSLGPGAWGGSSTGDNVSDRHLTNRKRLAWGRDALSAAEDLKTDGISDERIKLAVTKALDELDAGDAEGLL
ncbi:MAG: hypothetical protein GF399_03325 [Candidatus Coatesbacteria bacterium]|nr:hypothetical protein [Candidatus Coatesbacteria bacterium]